MSVFSILQRPYPYTATVKSVFLSSIIIGVFVALFLIVFQPFGTYQWESPSKTPILIGYGIITLVFSIVAQFVLLKWIANEERWNIWKEGLSTMTVVCLIAIGNFFYSVHFVHISFRWEVFLSFIYSTFLIAFFPIALSILVKHNRYLLLNQKIANAINTNVLESRKEKSSDPNTVDEILFTSENEKDQVSISVSSLLYIQSADNYSEIVSYDTAIRKALLRSSLKRLDEQRSNPHLVRCHRSYIVNLLQVKHIEGNAQGYVLTFHNGDTSIPVSRNYSASVLQLLRNLK